MPEWKVICETEIDGDETKTLGEFETWEQARDFYVEIAKWWIALEEKTPYTAMGTKEVVCYGCKDCINLVNLSIEDVMKLKPNTIYDEGNFDGAQAFIVPSDWSYEDNY